jgi:DnaJ family protein A protein 2
MDPFEVFGNVFGGRRRRTPDARYNVALSLEEMFSGCARKLQVTRNRACGACAGTGSASGACTTCADCRGAGVRVHHRQMGRMVECVQTACGRCQGSGRAVAPGDACAGCEGKRVVREKEVLHVELPPGVREGQQVAFRGKADEEPDVEAGDLVFVVRQREPHATFERRGNDLLMTKVTQLRDALCGFDFLVRHLDGRALRVRADGVIRPGEVLRVPNEGMPVAGGSPAIRGDLYVRCEVVFPDAIDARTEMALAAYFPSDAPPTECDEDRTALRVSREELHRKGHLRGAPAGGAPAGGAPAGGAQQAQCVHQ